MSNTITTINPYTGKEIKEYTLHTSSEIDAVMKYSNEAQKSWKKTSIKTRTNLLEKVSKKLTEKKDYYASLITEEMGKPITESIAEIEKCASICDFYAVNASNFLADSIIDSDAKESFVSYDPMGCILGIMPWNFPFYQVIRFAIPTLMAGNTVIIKHATNVTGCAMALEELFVTSEFPENTYKAILTTHEVLEDMIGNPIIKAVSLTGSEKAGREVAAIAGKNLKKSVLELGGTNACIVLEDADLEKHMETMVAARYMNNGQSCIAAKRFIVLEEIYDTFIAHFTKAVKTLKIGDPTKKETQISVLSNDKFVGDIKELVADSVKKGAKVHLGNETKDAHYSPTILTEVTEDMTVFNNEVFGPVAAVIKAKNLEHALSLNSKSSFGLGTMLFTKDTDEAKYLIDEIEDGAFFINEMVKSEAKLPFGGTKNSGYGRELSKEGILEFVNQKTVYIK